VEREALQRGAQLAGQEEWSRVAAAAEVLDAWLAAFGKHARPWTEAEYISGSISRSSHATGRVCARTSRT